MEKPVHSEWITANAGSGKTTELTRRVLRLLLQGVPPEHIVCITYTKAAAHEMRSRVLDGLRELLLLNDEKCAEKIENLLGNAADSSQNAPDLPEKPPDLERITHARNLFGMVLDSPAGGLQLTTIHGFCQNLLRRFPIEAGIAPHFTVLEDASADEALRQSKHALLTHLESADRWLTDALALLGARGGEFRFEALAAESIAKRRLWSEIWRAQPPEILQERLLALHGLETGISHETLDAWLCGCIGDADATTLRGYLTELTTHSNKDFRKLGERLQAWLAEDSTARIRLIDGFCDAFMTQAGTRRKKLIDAKAHPQGSPLHETIERLADTVERYTARKAALACAEESFAVAVLAKAMLSHYAQAKEAMHALDYDDLIDRAMMLCSQPETLGWVMSKLDHRIDHLMIDEAQDNSAPQWQLAPVLVAELIAANEGVGSANLPRSLLVVGDEKQSIYSFQGAAPELFARYQQSFGVMLEGSPSPLVPRALLNSYRSAEAVLKLVNDICAQPEMAQALSSHGQIGAHVLQRANYTGRVVMYPLIKTPEKETVEPLVIPTEYTLAANASQMLAESIAETISGWLNDPNRLLESEGRRLRAGDILILVHKRKPLVQPLIRALQRRNVAVAGIDRLALAEHLAVRDLLALMAWCGNVADDLALAQVLRSPLVGMSDEQLRMHAYGRTGNLWQEMENPWLAHLLTRTHLTPYDFLTEVLEVDGKRRDFARRFGAEVHEVLDELKAQAAAMPASLSTTLAQFRHWIEHSTREIKREQETGGDQVRIMTVHGAKGLEAPVVLLADTVNVPTTQHERLFVAQSEHGQKLPVLAMSEAAKASSVLVQAKQEKAARIRAEYFRLLYVALTRARHELHLFGTASAKGEVRADAWYAIVRESLKRLMATDQDGVLELRDQRPAREPGDQAMPVMPPEVLPGWVSTAPAIPEMVRHSLAPSHLGGIEETSPLQRISVRGAKERGVRIHRVLELLDARSDAASIAEYIRYVAPDWSAREQARAADEILALHRQEHWLWQHKMLREVSIAGMIEHAGERFPVSGQIDALVDTGDKIVILDYKTGAHIPANMDEVPCSYLLQLKIYQALVRQLYPDKPVRCAILWTAGPHLLWVDEAVERTEFPDKNVMLKSPVAA